MIHTQIETLHRCRHAGRVRIPIEKIERSWIATQQNPRKKKKYTSVFKITVIAAWFPAPISAAMSMPETSPLRQLQHLY
jgi:hypothetical protein